jgi:hypothetical protein
MNFGVLSRKQTCFRNAAVRDHRRWIPEAISLRLLAMVTLLVAAPLHAAESDPLKPPAIETQEVPVIPPEFAARLSQYQNTVLQLAAIAPRL